MPTSSEKRPTRFIGSVMISPELPAMGIHQIVEAIVEQLTTLPGSQVKLRLEIEAEVSSGLELVDSHFRNGGGGEDPISGSQSAKFHSISF